MPFYQFILTPMSSFMTPIKGDTLFGHICWQLANDPELAATSLDILLADYAKKPFLVVSSGFSMTAANQHATFLAPRPNLPASSMINGAGMTRLEKQQKAKFLKRMRWIQVDTEKWLSHGKSVLDLQPDRPSSTNLFNTDMLMQTELRQHNTINRLTQTTGKGQFAPYQVAGTRFAKNVRLCVFAYLNTEMLSPEALNIAVARIGAFGYGKDASIGMGRFEVETFKEIQWPLLNEKATGLYTLSPANLCDWDTSQTFSTPFIRYGKHGDRMATHGNPFKNPVIMADEGAVLARCPLLENSTVPGVVGAPANHISISMPSAICQGYALGIPWYAPLPNTATATGDR
ncbi:MAG: hypothetical protein JXX14_17760 [Deltaproteobacteria bacterium]|nr:hypothetical protein [Deltaproteobacteria bacterium]